eukprot:12155277-Ditylum_brightwellii.AAC.1
MAMMTTVTKKKKCHCIKNTRKHQLQLDLQELWDYLPCFYRKVKENTVLDVQPLTHISANTFKLVRAAALKRV